MSTREEQVSALACALFNKHTDIDECIAIANKYIKESEERARAECAADTRRLEWLAKCASSVGGRYFGTITWKIVLYTRSSVTDLNDPAGLRAAIDAAMEAQNG